MQKKYINILIEVCKMHAARHLLVSPIHAALNNVIASTNIALWRNAHRYFVHNQVSMSTQCRVALQPKCNLHALARLFRPFSTFFRRKFLFFSFFSCIFVLHSTITFSNRFEHRKLSIFHLKCLTIVEKSGNAKYPTRSTNIFEHRK